MNSNEQDNQYHRQADPGGLLSSVQDNIDPDVLNQELNIENQIDQKKLADQDALQKMYADERTNLEDNDYLVWEPLTPAQKISALFSNTLEVFFVVVYALWAINYPSMISVSLLLLSLPLLYASTSQQQKRWYRVACVLGMNQLLVVAIVGWKVRTIQQIDLIPVEQDLKVFTKLIRYYESIGLDLVHNLYSPTSESTIKYEITSVNFWGCFTIEAIYSILIIYTMILVCLQIKRVKYLSDQKNRKSIERLQLLLDDPTEREKVAAHNQELQQDLKPAELTRLKREEAERLGSLAEELKQLRKKVQVTFVDSYFFFKQDQKFFLLLLLTQLIEAMTFNSCSDIPALLFIAVMAAFYSVRKSYSVAYRVFCFFVVYYIMALMLLKIIHEVVTQIGFINKMLNGKQYTGYKSVQFVNIVFGAQHGATASDRAQELFSTVFCFVCCCFWRTAKWIEIRNKTKHTKNLSSFGLLRAYFMKRREEDDLEVRLRENKKLNPKERQSLLEAAEKRKRNARRSRYIWLASENAAKKSLQDFNRYVPLISLWVTRVNLFCLTYAYHSFGGIFLLIWIICSFTIPETVFLYLSALVMAPAMALVFLVIYCSKIPVISNSQFFQNPTTRYLTWVMKNPILEQTAIYLTLAIFLMMVLSSIAARNKKVALQKEEVKQDELQKQNDQAQAEREDKQNQDLESKDQDLHKKLVEEYEKYSQQSDQNQLLAFFAKRITQKRFSNKWRVLFLLSKYIQTAVLLGVFVMGLSALDEYKSLGFMVFFIVYTAYESVYRRTGFLLVIWISFFIFERYAKSLVCHHDNVSRDIYDYLSADTSFGPLLRAWEQINTKYVETGPQGSRGSVCARKATHEGGSTEWDPAADMYFRTTPSPSDWLVLVAMSLLSSINAMHLHDPAQVDRLSQECLTRLRDKNEKATYYLNRVKSIVMGLVIYLVLILMVFMQSNLQTNIINYVFFVLNWLNLATLIQGEAKVGALRRSLRLANFVKIYALAINLAQIAFFVAFGSADCQEINESKETSASDQAYGLNLWLAKEHPTLCRMLPYIGFKRSQLGPQIEDGKSASRESFQKMFITYVVFFLLSLYLIWHFETAIKNTEGEAEFRESHYKKIFEFRTTQQYDQEKAHQKKKHQHQLKKRQEQAANEKVSKQSQQARVVGAGLSQILLRNAKKLKTEREEILDDGADTKSGAFKKKKVYEQKDFVDFYESVRFSLPFMVYRAMNRWPMFDFLATYGHIINNLAVIYVATQLNVNFYMFFNVCSVCYFYSVATVRLSADADKLTASAGLQGQIDIRTASMVSDEYKKRASYEFLKLRRTIWHFQFAALLIVVWVGFPTELLYRFREKSFGKTLNDKPNISSFDYASAENGASLKLVDDVSFWLFFFGLYKDPQRDDKGEYISRQTYWITVLCLLIGLVFERQAINWLTDRFGCTHHRLQKFVELDMRRESLRTGKNGVTWEVCPSVYDVERYRQHYFENDFDELKAKFIDNTGGAASEKDEEDKAAIGDFVPYEKAVMIRETIKFSLFVDGRCSLVKQDEQAKELLGSQQVKITREKPGQIEVYFKLAYPLKLPAGYSLLVVGDLTGENLEEIGGDNLEESPYLIKDEMVPADEDRALWNYQFVVRDTTAVTEANLGGLNVKEKELTERPLLVYKYCLIEIETGKLTWESTSNRQQNVFVEEVEEFSDKHRGTAAVFDAWQAGRVHAYNYESIPILKAFKLEQLQRILKDAVSFKYKTSFLKGLKHVFENLVLLLLLVSIIVKSNFYSILYLAFVFRFVVMRNKDVLIVKANAYMAFFFAFQYFLYLITLSSRSSPQQFPRGFADYPRNVDQQQKAIPGDLSIRFSVPVLFHFEPFRNLQFAFLLGAGLDSMQLATLILDFVNLYLISMYILTFRNPIYNVEVRKVFWQYPTPDDSKQWNRLDETVQRAVLWLYNPIKLEAFKGDQSFMSQLAPGQIENAEALHRFATRYGQLNKYDLNYHLTTYVDLKYEDVWSAANLREKKSYIKVNSVYYRIVKQGSKFVYLTLHIFAIFAILVLSIIRASLISVGYVALLLPHLKAAARVLDQRQINASRLREAHKHKQGQLIEKQSQYKPYQKEYKDIRKELMQIEESLQSLQQKGTGLTQGQKLGERKKGALKKWSILNILQIYVLSYSILDFTCNTFAQLPVIAAEDVESGFIQHVVTGKIWGLQSKAFSSYEHWINETLRTESALSMRLDRLAVQCLMCFTIFMVALQSDVFNSSGYNKFVTQIGGSLDGFMQVSGVKAMIITQIFNNYKIKKIASLQKKRETIMATVERMKEKLINWRKFTRAKLTGGEQDEWLGAPVMVLSKEQYEDLSEVQNSKQEETYLQVLPEQNNLRKQPQNEGTGIDRIYPREAKKRVLDLSAEEMEEIVDEIAHLFTKSKMKKMRACIRLYQWLNITFTEQIMFKSSTEDLDYIRAEIAEGGTNVYTELEDIMWAESRELVRGQFCHLDGRRELAILLEKKSNMHAEDTPEDFLLQITRMDKIIKLKDMPKTWEFTRPAAMVLRFVETLVYICVSNSHNLVYLAMILSAFTNAGLLSLFYPIMVFGSGMLAETRPRKEFWDLIRNYNTFLLIVKLAQGLLTQENQMNVLDPSYINLLAFLKIQGGPEGQHGQDIGTRLRTAVPEALILCFIMFNEIKLKIIGLYYQIEEDIEDVLDGIRRVELQGDEKAVQLKQLEDSKMYLQRYFESVEQQREREREALEAHKEEIRVELRKEADLELKKGREISQKREIVEYEVMKQLNDPRTLAEKQQQQQFDISESVKSTSKQFTLDLDFETYESPWDYLIGQNVIQKTLESDDLIFVEGARKLSQHEFMSAQNFKDEELNADGTDGLSACDHEQEFLDKFDAIDHRQQQIKGFFENSHYFSEIFPSSKLQKPGYDLYGSTTLVLGLIAGYIFYCFPYYTVDPGIFEWIAGQSSIFKGDYALTMLAIIIIMLVERYANRSDTVGQLQKREKLDGLDGSKAQNKKNFFSDAEIFKTSQKTQSQRTMRAMTARKTGDLNVQGKSEQTFLKQLYANEQKQKVSQQTGLMITNQQKVKYIVHWFILILGHLYVFYFIPISGNVQLYDGPICKSDIKENKCYDFDKNIPLQILYLLIVLYLCLSALQIRYGFPTLKKPSSVLNNYNNLQQILAQIYQQIPFAVELRCLLDYTFTKTSLDLFQFFQLWQFHFEMYNAKISGNYLARLKVLGSAQYAFDKCIFGLLFSFIMLGLMAGPFLLFSEYGGLIAPNPVLKADLKVSFLINSTHSLQQEEELTWGSSLHSIGGKAQEDLSDASASKYHKTIPFDATNGALSSHDQTRNTSTPYLIYADTNMYISTFTVPQWKASNQSRAAETKFFEANQVQEIEGGEYSDSGWLIPERLQDALYDDLELAVNTPENSRLRTVTLQLDMNYLRDQPATGKVVPVRLRRDLNYSEISDCIAGLQLNDIKNLKCANEEQDGKKFVVFRKAVMNEMVLGQTNLAKPITVKKANDNNWLDILLEYNCEGSWIVRANQTNTQDFLNQTDKSSKCYNSDDYECKFWNQAVDPETCLPRKLSVENKLKNISKEQTIAEILILKQKQFEQECQSQFAWDKISFYVFSMLVSSSFLASMTPLTFYTIFLLGLQPTIRGIFLYPTYKSAVYDCIDPDAVIRLVEACYIYRHECDLVGEEEVYRMILEILRSPEFYKAVQGTSLKGTTDPALDSLVADQKAKYLTLEKLEQKGFDVGKLKKKLISSSNKQEKDNDDERIIVTVYG